MTTEHPLIVALIGFLLVMVGCYCGGYLASCGWHQRKREFVRQMMTDSVEMADGETTKATA